MKRHRSAGNLSYTGVGCQIFSDHDLERIHLATLEVLEKEGVWLEDQEAMTVFENNGAIVDRGNQKVKIPSFMVEEAVKTAPPQVVLCGRHPKDDVILGGDRVSFIPFGMGTTVHDPYTGEHRDSTLKDYEDASLLIDALDNYDFLLPPIFPTDADEATWALDIMLAHFANSSKPLCDNGDSEQMTEMTIEMACLIAGGRENLMARPLLWCCVCPSSPLGFAAETTGDVMRFARLGLPSCALSMAMAGGTAPITLAGTLVIHNVEILTLVVLSQLVKKGAPVIYGSSTTALDLRRATAAVGSPELALLNGAVARLAKYYSLPSLVAGG